MGRSVAVDLQVFSPGAKVRVKKGKRRSETGVVVFDTENLLPDREMVLLEMEDSSVFNLVLERVVDLEVIEFLNPVISEGCKGCIFCTTHNCGRYSAGRSNMLFNNGGLRVPEKLPPKCSEQAAF